jgi:hypothetical protein
MKNAQYDLITEAADHLSENFGLNILSEKDAYASIVNQETRDAQINLIIESAGFDAHDADEFKKFANNSIEDFISESVTSQDIKPLAGFQLTLLKEIYMRQIGKRLATQEVMKTPSEKYGTFITVLIDAAGKRHTLKDITTDTVISDGWKQEIVNLPVASIDLFANARLTVEEQAVPNKMLDVKTGVVNVEMIVLDAAGANPETINVPVDLVFGEDNGFARAVSGKHSDGTINTDRLFGIIDYKTGKLSVQVEGTIAKKVTLKYRLSNSFAEINDYEMELEYTKVNVDVDDGRTINIGIPMNYLQDIKAYFSVDGMAKAVEKVSSAIAVLKDREILIEAGNIVGGDVTRQVNWNYTLPAGINRIDHNRELLEKINYATAISDSNTQFTTVSEYNIACNPVDASKITSPILIENADLANASVTGGSFGYSVAPMMSTSGKINILSTKQKAKGKMIVVPKTTSIDERILAHYTYSNVLLMNDYRNRRASNIKNMALKERATTKVHEGSAVTEIIIANA